jgi:cell division protein FtsB
MKIIEKTKQGWLKTKQVVMMVWRLWYMKYAVVCIVGVLFVGFLDENSVLSHLNNKKRISDLEKEIEYYEGVNQSNKDKIHQLQENPKAIEKIARERYFMKTDEEDIFVLSDDDPVNKEGVKYEAAE